MPNIHSANPLPRAAVIAAGAVVVGVILAAGIARLTGVEVSDGLAPSTLEIALRFDDLADGGIAVRDAADGRVIERLDAGGNHFLRALMRGLVRERVRRGVGDEAPFQLAKRADGSLTLIDPVSRRVVDLGAFGSSNAGVFAAFLATPPIKNAALPTYQGRNP